MCSVTFWKKFFVIRMYIQRETHLTTFQIGLKLTEDSAQQHCMQTTVPSSQTIYSPDDTAAYYYSSREHLCIYIKGFNKQLDVVA